KDDSRFMSVSEASRPVPTSQGPGVDPGGISSTWLFTGFIGLLIVGILVLDLMLPHTAPMWGLYVLPLILAYRLRQPRLPLYLAALFTLLVLVEAVWVGADVLTIPGLLNRLLGISVFWIIGFLLEHRRVTEADTLFRDRRYRAAIESTPDGFCRVNAEGQIIEVNDNYSRLSGYSVEELLQMRITDLDVNHNQEDVIARTRFIREQGKQRFETLHRKKDGTIWPVEVTATSLANQAFVVAFLRDMTEQRKVEEELRAQRLQLETLVEHAPDAIVVFDIDTMKFTMVNRNAEQLFGLDRSQLLQMGPDELSPPTQPNGKPSSEMALEKLNTALEKGEITFEWTHRSSTGRVFPCEVRLLRYPDRQRRMFNKRTFVLL
ncbi:MAG: PAS domain S-box protein, partial [Gemmataceae bacterium]